MNSGNEDNFDWDAEWEALDAADESDLIHHLAPGTRGAVDHFLRDWAEFYKKSTQVRRNGRSMQEALDDLSPTDIKLYLRYRTHLSRPIKAGQYIHISTVHVTPGPGIRPANSPSDRHPPR